MRRILLIDANNLAHRAFHANHLHDQKGRPTGAIYGFLRSLQWARYKLDLIPWENTAIIWDGGRCQKRLELYPEYKAGRRMTDGNEEQDKLDRESFAIQANVIRKMLSYLPAAQVRVDGTEADDLISVFTHLIALEDKNEVVVYSGDQDLWWLARLGGTTILDAKKGYLERGEIEHSLGFDVSRLPTYKAIKGDPSDNIKGADRIGDARAKLVLPFIDFDEEGSLVVKGDPPPSTEKWITKILDQKPQVELAYKLVKLPAKMSDLWYTLEQQRQAAIQLNQRPQKDMPALAKEFEEWGMDSLLENIHLW